MLDGTGNRKLDIKQNAFYFKTREVACLASETKFFCYSRVRVIYLYFKGSANIKLYK